MMTYHFSNSSKIYLLSIICWFLSIPIGVAQQITGVASKWSDSFKEWEVYTDDEDIIGNISLQWAGNDDWSAWNYRVGDHFGTIRLKWANDESQWELRGEQEIITARTLWRNDFSAWNCYDGKRRIKWKALYKTEMDEWSIEHPKDNHSFNLYTEWTGDPRAWVLEDISDETLSFPYKMMLIFIAIYQSSPRQ